MQAYLQFDLPVDNDEYKMHCQTSELHCAVWDYAQWLRGICKHGEPKHVDANQCRDKLFEFLNDRNITLI